MQFRYFHALLSVVVLSGCATARTKQSDPIMRVAIDPQDMTQGQVMRLQASLMRQGAFQVVDRGRGFNAAKNEQEMERKSEGHRFGSPEKYAEWGKLYGVGGVIVANADCSQRITIGGSIYFVCQEQIVLYDATTGQVMAASEAQAETSENVPSPGWLEAVEKLAEAYPSKMVDSNNPHQTIKYSTTLEKYRSKIQKEDEDSRAGREPASDSN